MNQNESKIRTVIENWAKAVRQNDLEGILANHTADIVMYDVPPPFKSVGLVAYKKTWTTFFDWEKGSGVFDIADLEIVSGHDVAFGFATMQCQGFSESGKAEPLQFRLTIGLVKIDDNWLIRHEHHSIPAG